MILSNSGNSPRKTENFPLISSDARRVRVMIEFTKLGEIDNLNDRYQAVFNIDSSWIEPTDIDFYDPSRHWNPKLYIENAFQEPKEAITYSMRRDSEQNLVITEHRETKGYFWERLELESFPIDVQELSITLASRLDSHDIHLEADPSNWSHLRSNTANIFVEQQKWKLYKYIRIRDSASYDIVSKKVPTLLMQAKKTPKVVATCFCSRKGGYYIFNAYFLIFLVTISALNIFSIDCKLPQNRLHINSVLLLTSVSFKWVINRSLPSVSYLTSLDKYAIVCIFYVCLLSVWHSIVGSFWTQETACKIDKWALLGFVLIFFLIHVGLCVWFLIAYRAVWFIKAKEKKFLENYRRSLLTLDPKETFLYKRDAQETFVSRF